MSYIILNHFSHHVSILDYFSQVKADNLEKIQNKK